MKVLYVEDNPANVALVKRVARMGNHEIINYIDGDKAIAKFDEIAPDLVLMDIQLAGGKTGLDVVRQLRSQGVTTTIIAVTAYAMVGDKERALDAGCDDYLPKPLPINRLVEIFNEHSSRVAKATPDIKTTESETPKAETPPVQAKVSETVTPKVEDPVAEVDTATVETSTAKTDADTVEAKTPSPDITTQPANTSNTQESQTSELSLVDKQETVTNITSNKVDKNDDLSDTAELTPDDNTSSEKIVEDNSNPTTIFEIEQSNNNPDVTQNETIVADETASK